MVSIHVDIEEAEWTPGIPFYGPAARYDGKDIVQLKVLSDRRAEGGGIAWLGKFSPPPGKLIKIVAIALSESFQLPLLATNGDGKKTFYLWQAGRPLAAACYPPSRRTPFVARPFRRVLPHGLVASCAARFFRMSFFLARKRRSQVVPNSRRPSEALLRHLRDGGDGRL